MQRKFKIWSYGIVQVERVPRDFWFVFDFDEKDNIKSVCVYARKWFENTVEWNHYSLNSGTSTFLYLCRFWRWLQDIESMEKQDIDRALSVDFEFTIKENYYTFIEKFVN